MEFDKETRLCLSISARPSNFGTRFHNFLYRELGLNFVYKACAVEDIEGAVRGIRSLKIRGSAVSMPYKESVIAYLDEVDPPAREIGAVNTIVNDGGRLRGFNTDVVAVRDLLSAEGVDRSVATVLLGSGGMAKAIAHALRELGFSNVRVVARNRAAGTELASRYGFSYSEATTNRVSYFAPGFLINATPIGMAPDPANRIPFSPGEIEGATWLMDSVANPSETALVRHAREGNKRVVTGFDIVTKQAIEQFRLYTGIRPDQALARRAAEYARV